MSDGMSTNRFDHASHLLSEARSLFIDRVVWRPGVKPPQPSDYAGIAKLLREAESASRMVAEAFERAAGIGHDPDICPNTVCPECYDIAEARFRASCGALHPERAAATTESEENDGE